MWKIQPFKYSYRHCRHNESIIFLCLIVFQCFCFSGGSSVVFNPIALGGRMKECFISLFLLWIGHDVFISTLAFQFRSIDILTPCCAYSAVSKRSCTVTISTHSSFLCAVNTTNINRHKDHHEGMKTERSHRKNQIHVNLLLSCRDRYGTKWVT